MKRILFLTIVFHTLYFSLYSQVISSIKSHFDTSIATLYEYGQQIKTCECNLDNLFRNWTTQFITNAQDTELISYKFVETIKDTVRVNYYADLLLNINVLQSAVRGSNSSESTENGEIHYKERFFEAKSYSQVFADSLLGNNKDKFLALLKKHEIEPRKSDFKHLYVHIGDKVYLIKSKINGKEYDNYVICNPNTKRIVWDNLFYITSYISNLKLY